MAAREYVGAGGARIHLDDPLSLEMAKQVAKGHLVLVCGSEVTVDASPAVVVPAPAGHEMARPAKGAAVGEWRTYAVALGMDPDDAKDATKGDCLGYIEVTEQG